MILSSDRKKSSLYLVISVLLTAACGYRETERQLDPVTTPEDGVCRVLADKRLQQPLEPIAAEFARRTGLRVDLTFLPTAGLEARAGEGPAGCDVILGMPERKDGRTTVAKLPGATKVAWKYPSGEPVWAAATTDRPGSADFVRFAGGPTAHRIWSKSEAGFTIVGDMDHATATEWVSEHRVKHTYVLTAMRMLGECGGIREGVMIDIGCGPGHLDVELAKRSKFKVIGLDIDPGARRFFEERMREEGLSDRVSFVEGDAQKLPFPDDSADVIVSRGTLVFIPDIAKCLREVRRVLKPTGVAFLGGRYLFTPQKHMITLEKLKRIVRESGVPGAKVIDWNGQWVKIVGPKAPKAAHGSGIGPHMLPGRLVAEYGVTEGACLLLCGGGGEAQQALLKGFVEVTALKVTALYDTEKAAEAARKRIRGSGWQDRIACRTGTLTALPFDAASFDLVAGVGPMLIFQKDRARAMREIHRVLKEGGAARIGGRFVGMPSFRRVSSETLRRDASKTGLPSIRILDTGGQWVEIIKGVR
jgi:ubiquinone/menaquinone biosynthesis C-methylase UbiE